MPGPMSGGNVREDPLVSAHFYLTVDGHVEKLGFRQVTGIGSTTEAVQSKEAMQGDFHSIIMVPGRLSWSEVSCKRGITSSMSAWNWRKLVEDGQVEQARANGSIVAVNQQGTEVARWNFLRCWPTAISGPQFDSTQNEAALEELKFQHEGCVRVK